MRLRDVRGRAGRKRRDAGEAEAPRGGGEWGSRVSRHPQRDAGAMTRVEAAVDAMIATYTWLACEVPRPPVWDAMQKRPVGSWRG